MTLDARRGKRSTKKDIKASSKHVQRPGQVGSRRHANNFVPTPGSPPIDEIRTRKRRRIA